MYCSFSVPSCKFEHISSKWTYCVLHISSGSELTTYCVAQVYTIAGHIASSISMSSALFVGLLVSLTTTSASSNLSCQDQSSDWQSKSPQNYEHCFVWGDKLYSWLESVTPHVEEFRPFRRRIRLTSNLSSIADDHDVLGRNSSTVAVQRATTMPDSYVDTSAARLNWSTAVLTTTVPSGKTRAPTFWENEIRRWWFRTVSPILVTLSTFCSPVSIITLQNPLFLTTSSRHQISVPATR